MRDHQIVQTKLEHPMRESLEPDLAQHGLQFVQRDALFVLLAFHFFADDADLVENVEDWIHGGIRPRHDQRAAGNEYPVRFPEHVLWLREMFEHGEHDRVIKLCTLYGQAFGDVGEYDRGAVQCTPHLIIEPDGTADARTEPGQKPCLKSASDVAATRAVADMRQRRAEPAPRDETVECSVGHLRLELVVADVGATTD